MRTILILLFVGGLVEPISAQWRTTVSTEEMTGDMSVHAISPRTASTKPMNFPYYDTEAWLGVGCNGKTEWAYVGFSEAPNLTNTQLHSGYSSFRARVKWNDEVVTMSFTQDWGARFIHFGKDRDAISRIASTDTVLLELQWYGEGRTYFRFPLSGSPAALKEAQELCANLRERKR